MSATGSSVVKPSTVSTHRPGMSAGRVYNLCAGPSLMPDDVLRQMQADLLNYKGSGCGITELSHRGALFDELLHQVERDIRSLANIPANYRVLFMTGGSTGQNFMVPLNLLEKGQTADYVETGYWAQRSVEDCRQAGYAPHVAFTDKPNNFRRIPTDSELNWSGKAGYVHFTSNNTIYGTQWHRLPKAPSGVPLVCDACSDIFSRPIDVTKYGLIYASAQKNLGITGTTLVIISDELVDRGRKDIPRMLQYRTFAKEESRPNTPPHVAIYSVALMARWIIEQGGVAALERRNVEKAQLLYDALDEPGFYRPHADRAPAGEPFNELYRNAGSRSMMNVVFRCPTEQLDELFCNEAERAGFVQLKGHRVAGGMRLSVYNAFPREGCVELAKFLREFARRHA
jgi:phosphoserine aminotransferase